MKSKLRSYGLRAKSSPAAFTVLMWFVALLYWEIMLHVVAFGGFHWRNFYMLGFTALIAVLASLLCTMFPRRINRIVFTVLLIVAFALYTSQLIYLQIFGSFYSVSMMQMGGKALQSFWKETSSTVIQNILLLLAMLVPVIASFFAKKINPRAFTQLSWRRGLQVLADGQNVAPGLQHIVHQGADLLVCLAQADHKARLGQDSRILLLAVAQHLK